MARITVEDCIDKFPSRFELVLVASNRARKLHSGEDPTLERDNDKNTVIALREIAEGSLNVEELKNDLIQEYQTVSLNENENLLENSEAENTEGENSDEDIQLSDETMSGANEVDDINKDAMQEDKDISKQHDDALQEDNILNSENETPNESQEY